MSKRFIASFSDSQIGMPMAGLRSPGSLRLVRDVSKIGKGTALDTIAGIYPFTVPVSSNDPITIQDSSIDWTPGSALIFLFGVINGSDNALCSVGATDGTDEWVSTNMSFDNSTTSSTASQSKTGACLLAFTTGEAQFSQWLAGGLELAVTDQFISAVSGFAVFFHEDWSAKCGTFDPHNTQDQSISVSGLGHFPELVFASVSPFGFSSALGSDYRYSFGAWQPNGNQYAYVMRDVDGVSPTQVDAILHSDRVGAESPTGTEFQFSTPIGGGFDCTTRAGNASSNTRIGYLSLGGLGARVHVGEFTAATSTGISDYLNSGFKPHLGMINSGVVTATDTVFTDARAEVCTISGFSTLSASNCTFYSENGETASSSNSLYDTRPYKSVFPDGGFLQNFASLSGFVPGGYRLNYSLVQDTTARKGFEVTIGI